MTPQAIVNARAKALLGLMAVAGLLFCARLFYLQVIRHDYYEQQAVAEHELFHGSMSSSRRFSGKVAAGRGWCRPAFG